MDTEEADQKEEVVPSREQKSDQEEELPKVDDVKEVIDTDTKPIWEKMQDKIEDLTGKVAEYFDDSVKPSSRTPPIIKAPPQPTATEFEQHQATHTPYAHGANTAWQPGQSDDNIPEKDEEPSLCRT